jgi:hypothetical protein
VTATTEQTPILNEERIETKTPEAELWRAVIDQAIDDLSDPDLGEATIEWFTSALDEPGTFRWICVHLDLNAAAVWAALSQRKDRKKPAKLFACAAPSKRLKPDEHRPRLRSVFPRRENRKSFAARFLVCLLTLAA